MTARICLRCPSVVSGPGPLCSLCRTDESDRKSVRGETIKETVAAIIAMLRRSAKCPELRGKDAAMVLFVLSDELESSLHARDQAAESTDLAQIQQNNGSVVSRPPSVPPPQFAAAEMHLALGDRGFFSGHFEICNGALRYRGSWAPAHGGDGPRWNGVKFTGWHESADDVIREVIAACAKLDEAAPELTGGCGNPEAAP